MKSNPFATRFVAPGCIRWIADGEESVDSLVDRFQKQLHHRAAIVGPHGTGKSTLLEHLTPRLGAVCYRDPGRACMPDQQSGNNVVWLQLRRPSNAFSRVLRSLRYWRRDRLLVLDGFEQLFSFTRLWVRWLTRRKRMGLLVTAHRPVALPVLCRTRVTAEKASSIVFEILQRAEFEDSLPGIEYSSPMDSDTGVSDTDVSNPGPSQVTRFDPMDVELLERMLVKHEGNMREVLMDLFDEVQWAKLAERSGERHPDFPVLK